MFPSTRSLFRHSTKVLEACTTGPKSRLPPIRYHIFEQPLPYTIGLKLQNDIIEKRLRWKEAGGGKDDIVLLLEHTPTYTTGRRDNSPNPDTLHPEEKKVQNVGAEFHITKRGGQVTYHGPGQLVGYPIMDLNAMETPTRCYVDWLQGILKGYTEDIGCQGIMAPHPDGHVGVFASPTEKVASIGIHLRHRMTSHGFAINVTKEPVPWFDLVLACGLADVRAVSLEDLQEGKLSVRDVARGLLPRFEKTFGRELVGLDGGGEVGELIELVERAESDAKEENERRGGWRTGPDLTKRVL